MVTNFKRAISLGWLRALQSTLIMLLIGASSLTSLAKADEDKNQEENSYWGVVVVAENIMDIVKEAGGEWIPVQNLPLSDKADSYYEGFIYHPINCAVVGKKEVINKIVPDNCKIIDRDTWKEIPVAEFREMPVNKILVIMIYRSFEDENQIEIRVGLNNKDYKTNPLIILADDLFAIDTLRQFKKLREQSNH